MSIKTIRYNVIRLLKEKPETRDSDKALLQEYYKQYESKSINLKAVQTNPITIWRSRQWIQAHNPLLRANPEIQAARTNLEEEYKQEFRGLRAKSPKQNG